MFKIIKLKLTTKLDGTGGTEQLVNTAHIVRMFPNETKPGLTAVQLVNSTIMYFTPLDLSELEKMIK